LANPGIEVTRHNNNGPDVLNLLLFATRSVNGQRRNKLADLAARALIFIGKTVQAVRDYPLMKLDN